LRSPTAVGDYILIVDSSSSGRLLAYKRSDLTLAGQVNIGSYPQEMVIHNNVAYVADGDSQVRLIDIANLPTMTALSYITVGNKPTVVRKWGGKIYVGNQDWEDELQASVSVIDPATNTVTHTFNTGPNNMDIAYDGTRIWTHNPDWYGSLCQAASLTYAPVDTYIPTNITPPAPYDTNSNCAKGSLAFNNTTGYAILRQGSGGFHLFTISGTTLNDPPIDSTNRYVFVGNTTQYLAKVHNGDGSTNNLTVVIEDLNNNVLTTQTLTKDTDMYFFLNP
jgi:YVTN family beta-propeller protein